LNSSASFGRNAKFSPGVVHPAPVQLGFVHVETFGIVKFDLVFDSLFPILAIILQKMLVFCIVSPVTFRHRNVVPAAPGESFSSIKGY
jgi:hypothetical protein